MTAGLRDIQVSHVNHSVTMVREAQPSIEFYCGLLGFKRALQDKDIPVEHTGVRKDGQRFLFIRDPDGNRVELCTPSGF